MVPGIRLCLRKVSIIDTPFENFSFYEQQWIASVAIFTGECQTHQPGNCLVTINVDITVKISFEETDIAEEHKSALRRQSPKDDRYVRQSFARVPGGPIGENHLHDRALSAGELIEDPAEKPIHCHIDPEETMSALSDETLVGGHAHGADIGYLWACNEAMGRVVRCR
jgi:hypothetical protein